MKLKRVLALYQRDLAYIHHVGFGDFSRRAATELIGILKRAGVRKGVLLDLACGSGIWAAHAQRAGFQVLGMDQSLAMIRLARSNAPQARFKCGSLYDVDLPRCDVITVLGEGLNYLPAKGGAGPSVDQFFKKAAHALRPGGLLIFDVMVSGGPRMNYRLWKEGLGWAVLTEISEPVRNKLLSRWNVIFRKSKLGWRRSEETHRIRLLEPADLMRSLRRAGFAVRISSRYGRMPLLPRRQAFIARKL